MKFISIKGVKGDTLHIRPEAISAIVGINPKTVDELLEEDPILGLLVRDTGKLKKEIPNSIVLHGSGQKFMAAESAEEILTKMQVH